MMVNPLNPRTGARNLRDWKRGSYLSDAVEQCEEHTSWSNELLRSAGLGSMVDIRKSFADGITLINLIEILSNEKLSGIHRSPSCRAETVENLTRCVDHLEQQGVDTAGISPDQLAGGNLKATLMLMNNIRKRYDSQYGGRDADGSSRPNSSGSYSYRDTPPALPPPTHRDNTLSRPRTMTDPPPPPAHNSSSVVAQGIPHSLSTEHMELQPRGGPRSQPPPHPLHSASTTHWGGGGGGGGGSGISPGGGGGGNNVGTGGRPGSSLAGPGGPLLTSSSSSGPMTGPPSRPRSAGPGSASGPSGPPPPSKAQAAWTASQSPGRQRAAAPQPQPSSSTVEHRLKSLITSTQPNNIHGVYNTAFDYEDGELIQPPHPRLNDSSFEDPAMQYKYEPSQPSEAAGRPQQHTAPPVPPKYQPPPQYSPHPTPRHQVGGHGGVTGVNPHDLDPRVPPHHPSSSSRGGVPTHMPNVPTNVPNTIGAQQHAQPANDLRNACSKLYGKPPQISPSYPASTGKVAGYPSSPYLSSRTSPMGQSSSPPSHSSGGSSHNTNPRAPPPAPPQRAHPNNTATRGRAGGVSTVVDSHGEYATTSHPASHLSHPVGSAAVLSSSRPNSQERYPPQRSKTPEPQVPVSNKASPSAPASLSYQQQQQQQQLHRQTTKPPHVQVDSSECNVKSNTNINTNTHTQGFNNKINTSTPKGLAVDPYSRLQGLGSGSSSGLNYGQMQLLQSKSMVPDSISRPGSRMSSKQSISLDPNQWNKSYSDISSRSVTPPLPPLSPDNTPPATPPPPPHATQQQRGFSHNHHQHPAQQDRPDVVTSSTTAGRKGTPGRKKSGRGGGGVAVRTWDGRSKRSAYGGRPVSSRGGMVNGGAILAKPRMQQRGGRGSAGDTLSESPDDDEEEDSKQYVDEVEDSLASVTEDDGTGQEVTIIRQQLEGLESMYSEILKVLGMDKEYLAAGSRRSVSSLSSAGARGHHRRGGSRHRYNSTATISRRELKKVGQRFQRLESHVVTLARSVAHLSSELRSQNTLYQDVEEMKHAIEELRNRVASAPPPVPAGASQGHHHLHHPQQQQHHNLSEWEKFRGWVPALTNPKRVQKLKKFFGTDPPLLKLFLQKLGYERYSPNFEQEHISIVELPYLNEERLQKIGIPMGPRLRILQESQMCFRQDNFNIYIV